jgi:hypothetical protein
MFVAKNEEMVPMEKTHAFMHLDTRLQNGWRATTKLRETTSNMSFGPKLVDWASSLRKTTKWFRWQKLVLCMHPTPVFGMCDVRQRNCAKPPQMINPTGRRVPDLSMRDDGGGKLVRERRWLPDYHNQDGVAPWATGTPAPDNYDLGWRPMLCYLTTTTTRVLRLSDSYTSSCCCCSCRAKNNLEPASNREQARTR